MIASVETITFCQDIDKLKPVWDFLNSGFFGALATFFGILIGFQVFFVQQRWAQKAQAAEKILIAVTEFEDALKTMRNPYYSSEEGLTLPDTSIKPSIIDDDHSLDEKSKELRLSFIPIERTFSAREKIDALNIASTLSRVHFAAELQKQIQIIIAQYRHFFIASGERHKTVLEWCNAEIGKPDEDIQIDFIRINNSSDEIGNEVAKAKSRIEKLLEPYLSKR